MAQNVARLGVVLGLDTADFIQGLGKASTKLSEFVEKAKPALLGATAAMTALAVKTIAYADQVTDLADANDVAVSTVMALGSALAVSGGKAENAGKLLASLSSKIDSAAQGNEEAAKSFERVGVSISDIASMTNEQLLSKIVKSLAKMQDAVSRNAIAADIFSKAGKNIGWEQMNAALDKGKEKYKQYEVNIRNLADAADELALIMQTSMGEMANAIGEDFKTLIEYIASFQDKTSIMGRVVKTVFETIVVIGSDVAFVFSQIAKGLDLLASTSFTSIQKNIDQFKEYNEQAKKSREELDDFQKKILNNDPSNQSKANIQDDPAIKRAIELSAKNKEMLRQAQGISEEYKRQQVTQLQQLAIQELMVGMTTNERKVQEAINAVIQSTSQEIDKVTKQRMDAAGRGAGTAIIAEYDAQIAKIYELQEVYIQMSRTVAQTSIETQSTFMFGWNKAFNQFAEDSQNYARLAEEMFTSITGNMTRALDNFVETGKFSFSDFAQSIIKDLIKIQLRMQMMQLFSMGLNMLGGGMDSSAIAAGGGGGGFTGVGGASFSLPMAANGGDIDGPTIVGERGPEIFVPSRAGTVIPNHQLGSALGGNGTTINGPYIASMNAIDTQSGIQFLAKNKMTIWSMNQSANRSIPAGR